MSYSRLLMYTSPMMYGNDVKEVQSKLNQLGYNCGTADGWFGLKTKDAVIAFQRSTGLTTDGIVGPNTWNKLFDTSSSGGALTRTREYIETIEVSRSDCYKMMRALYELKESGFVEEDMDKFKSRLNNLSLGITLLSLLFKISTITSIAGAVATVISTITPSYKKEVESLMQEGHNDIEHLVYWFDDNLGIEKIRLRVSFFEFYGPFDELRFIQHTSETYIEQWRIDGKWLNLF